MEEKRHPVCGINYPGTFQEFDKWFSTEDACLAYIVKLRWPQGFVCPACGTIAEIPSIDDETRSFLVQGMQTANVHYIWDIVS